MPKKQTIINGKGKASKKSRAMKYMISKQPAGKGTTSDSLIDELMDFETDGKDWGSYQYEGARHACKVFMRQYRRSGKDLRKVLKKFQEIGIKISIRKVGREQTMKSMKKDFLKDTDDVYPENDPDGEYYRKRNLEGIKKMRTPDDAIRFCRDTAWDLFGAAPFVAGHCGIEILEIFMEDSSMEFVGLDTGILCALLRVTGRVSSEERFKNFDT
jgi:hypothetical protein